MDIIENPNIQLRAPALFPFPRYAERSHLLRRLLNCCYCLHIVPQKSFRSDVGTVFLSTIKPSVCLPACLPVAATVPSFVRSGNKRSREKEGHARLGTCIHRMKLFFFSFLFPLELHGFRQADGHKKAMAQSSVIVEHNATQTHLLC